MLSIPHALRRLLTVVASSSLVLTPAWRRERASPLLMCITRTHLYRDSQHAERPGACRLQQQHSHRLRTWCVVCYCFRLKRGAQRRSKRWFLIEALFFNRLAWGYVYGRGGDGGGVTVKIEAAGCCIDGFIISDLCCWFVHSLLVHKWTTSSDRVIHSGKHRNRLFLPALLSMQAISSRLQFGKNGVATAVVAHA